MPGDETPDPRRILAAAGWDAAGEVRAVSGGWDTRVWRFTAADGREHGLRLYRKGQDLEAQIVRANHEAAAIAAAVNAGIVAPTVEASGVFDGAPFMIQHWLPGRQMLDRIERTPWRVWTLGIAFGALQAEFHRLKPPGIRSVETIEGSVAASYPELVEALAPSIHADAFCHLDFHPLNVLQEGGRITGVVDFANAAISDRRADLGLTQAILVAAPLPPGPARAVMQVARRVFVRAWRTGYVRKAGDWPLTPGFEALGGAHMLAEITRATDEGRGWAKPEDLAALRKYVDAKMRAAGFRRA
jgi:aminoglycoside phosphotransferase (APT) family kinase protein